MNETGKVENSQSKLRKFPLGFIVVFPLISAPDTFTFEALR